MTSHDDTDITHNYATAGVYRVTISGSMPAWSFNNTGDKDKILKVIHFGDVGQRNMDGAFYGSTNLTTFQGEGCRV